MRWPAKEKIYPPEPEPNDETYVIRFAFLPHKTTPASGPHGWEREWVWLELIVKVLRWGSWGGWKFNYWYPLNNFTQGLVKNAQWK